jgi:hypothetical protein
MRNRSHAVLSYGEDPLTYDVLTSRLGEFLVELGDPADPSGALVIYRPSFGRGMGAHRSARQSTFGEFDAIVATSTAVYFIESKWHRSSEAQRRTVEVRYTQVARHEMLRWYRRHWSSDFAGKWADFAKVHSTEFERRFDTSCLPPAGSTLSENIEFVLRRLEPFPQDMVDVVLFVGIKGSRVPEAVNPPSFRLVALSYDGLEGTGYFEMGKQGAG